MMKIEVRGISWDEIKGPWYDPDGKYIKKGAFLGVYDGIEFISQDYKIEDLENFDILHLFTEGNLLQHSPKKYNKNIKEKLKTTYVRTFGEVIQPSFI